MSALAAETLSRVDAAEGLAALLAAEQAGNALDPNPAPLQPPPAMPMMPVHNYPGGYPYGVAHHGIGVPGISVAPSAARPRTSAPPKPALTAEEVYAIAESEGLTLLRAGGATGFKCAAHPGPARRPLLPPRHARAHGRPRRVSYPGPAVAARAPNARRTPLDSLRPPSRAGGFTTAANRRSRSRRSSRSTTRRRASTRSTSATTRPPRRRRSPSRAASAHAR